MTEYYVSQVVQTLLDGEYHRAVKYVSEKFVVAATRRIFHGRIDRRSKAVEVVLKIGRPNYAQRKFIAACRKAGEPFPVKKIQVQALPKRRSRSCR